MSFGLLTLTEVANYRIPSLLAIYMVLQGCWGYHNLLTLAGISQGHLTGLSNKTYDHAW